ncbi:MAG: DUF4124 domain-containing protein [Deltaproteobacteria bacterium]|nr:DUF4124 domain-containing protein [Deltaproteobacteria bacterium]
MKTQFIIIALAVLTATITTPASAEIYKCTDNSGQATFATKPGPGYRLLPGSAPADKRYDDGKKWHEGGNLHQASARIWNRAPPNWSNVYPACRKTKAVSTLRPPGWPQNAI